MLKILRDYQGDTGNFAGWGASFQTTHSTIVLQAPQAESGHSAQHAPFQFLRSPLRQGHFEVGVGPDGFPIELGAGAIAVTYPALDTA